MSDTTNANAVNWGSSEHDAKNHSISHRPTKEDIASSSTPPSATSDNEPKKIIYRKCHEPLHRSRSLNDSLKGIVKQSFKYTLTANDGRIIVTDLAALPPIDSSWREEREHVVGPIVRDSLSERQQETGASSERATTLIARNILAKRHNSRRFLPTKGETFQSLSHRLGKIRRSAMHNKARSSEDKDCDDDSTLSSSWNSSMGNTADPRCDCENDKVAMRPTRVNFFPSMEVYLFQTDEELI